MVYRDERAELRARIEAVADELAELRAAVQRLEVAAAAGALRGLSEEVALEIRRLVARVDALEGGSAAPRRTRRPSTPVPTDPIRTLVDQEATLTGRGSRRRSR